MNLKNTRFLCSVVSIAMFLTASINAQSRRIFVLDTEIEPTIYGNIKAQAAHYGFEMSYEKATTDYLLIGGAKYEQINWSHCATVYKFTVYRVSGLPKPKRLFDLDGPPTDIACVRLAVANNILSNLKDRLDHLPSPTKQPKAKVHNTPSSLRASAPPR